MIWNEKVECMSKEEKEALQLKRLKETVNYVYENVPLYKSKFDEVGLTPDDIQTLKDIEKIPFTTKEDLRSAYPFDLFAVSQDDVVELHSSSGTTGKPVVAGYTKNDLDLWGEIIARAIAMAGGKKHDKIQNAYGYGLFTGGFGIHHGALKFGAVAVPISSGNTKKQIEVMEDFQTNILTCTPSYALYIAESLEKYGVSLDDINLKSGIFGAEMWTEGLRDKLEEKLGILALNIYGLTEILGPGVATECSKKNGLHINDDCFYPEIIDPKTNKTLGEDEMGELVLTTLTNEAMPILRYRTKDLTSIEKDKCDCGRTTVRMMGIKGRTDDMLKIKGVKVFPSQIEKAMHTVEGVSGNYQIIVSREATLDELQIKVEISKDFFTGEIKKLDLMEINLFNAIRSETGLRAKIILSEPDSLPKSEGKAKRVIDKRKFE